MQSHLPITSKILFLSDVHLGAFAPSTDRQLESQLIALIDYAEREGYRMAVLGDLFDYWIEYPGAVPELGRALLQRFETFNRQHGASLYITGNHDNWTLGHFSRIGFDVEPDARQLRIGSRRYLLLHGDATGPSPQHLRRPLFHRLIRSPGFLKIYRMLLPPRAGRYVMQQFSKLSRVLGKEESDPAPLDNWARETLRRHDIDVVICGHDHRPRIHKYDYGTYINLGTFHHHHSLAEYNNGNLSLVHWNNNKEELLPYSTASAST